ncbi:molybdenum cofactor guanylyltransferase, partial [Kocuria nitroreducens]|uniref:molybdenum cofactor guanylyltransferase n=1 Tax=Kocuria nitroreducens TaxID=3058914 RepID=UPI0036DC6B64
LGALAVLEPAEWTMTLACDMPGVAGAVDRLRGAAGEALGAPGFMAVTPDGRRQPLAALYRTEVLRGAYSGQDPADRSVRSFVRDLALQDVIVADDATADVDTWDDVRRFHLD